MQYYVEKTIEHRLEEATRMQVNLDFAREARASGSGGVGRRVHHAVACSRTGSRLVLVAKRAMEVLDDVKPFAFRRRKTCCFTRMREIHWLIQSNARMTERTGG